MSVSEERVESLERQVFPRPRMHLPLVGLLAVWIMGCSVSPEPDSEWSAERVADQQQRLAEEESRAIDEEVGGRPWTKHGSTIYVD